MAQSNITDYYRFEWSVVDTASRGQKRALQFYLFTLVVWLVMIAGVWWLNGWMEFGSSEFFWMMVAMVSVVALFVGWFGGKLSKRKGKVMNYGVSADGLVAAGARYGWDKVNKQESVAALEKEGVVENGASLVTKKGSVKVLFGNSGEVEKLKKAVEHYING